MSRNEKRKMSFIPIVRNSTEGDDEDLLNKEMNELAQSSSEFPIRRTSGNIPKLKNLSKAYHNTMREQDDEEEDWKDYGANPNARLLEEVLDKSNEPVDSEGSGSKSSESSNLLKVAQPSKARMSEILEEISDDDQSTSYGDADDGNRKKKPNSYVGSSVSINVNDDNEDKFDHTPHDLFIQLNELQGADEYQEWRETARWIKYEENVEEGADRWGRPHVSSLSFHSLLNVRRCLEDGVVMLDIEEKDLVSVIHRIVETMYSEGVIRSEDRQPIFQTLLLNHNYDHCQGSFSFGMLRKSSSSHSLKSSTKSDTDRKIQASVARKTSTTFKKMGRRGSSAVFHPVRTTNLLSPMSIVPENEDLKYLTPPQVNILVDPVKPLSKSEEQVFQNEYLLKRLPPNCEGAAVLTGVADFLEQPTIAFVRLAEGIKMPNVLEVAVPVRFFFILMGPKSEDLDYHEVGRSISTLMSNKNFHRSAYKAMNRKNLMSGINNFLDDSLVLPPGKIDREALLPFEELKEKSDMIRMRKRRAMYDDMKSQGNFLDADQLKFLSDKFEASQKKSEGPLQRTGKPWGGLMNDLRRRLPMFKSDIVDGLNSETLAATVFMYFACFATAITFGGLAEDLTHENIGISETLLATSFVGIVFSLLGGQPLAIIGTTGPLILFDKALVNFCESQGFYFLNVRVYVGFWMIIIALIVSAFEGSTFVRFFTRFTQEIFSALITLIYLYSTFAKTVSIYKKNPLMALDEYTLKFNETDVTANKIVDQPNTALFCTLLTLGTFVLAYNLKIFRNSKFLSRTSRRALGDFGVPISITIFVIIANVMSQVTTEKLNVPDGIKPTKSRDWLIPLWMDDNPTWLPVACVVPGFLIYILAFMESHISELILDKPERKLKKGSGFHWDIVLLCFLNGFCGLFGMPWHCAAAVRSVAHISSVTVMSTNHPPGEAPHIVGVKEQRVSGFFVALLIGLSIFAAPVLKKIPISVLFGVFLYMGVCSMNGVQLFERIMLFFVPVKYHPHVPYATKVLTCRMHIYTTIQVVALAVLWTVNESPISLAFPFFLIMMVPLRKLMENFYSPSELEALDGAQQVEDDDVDEDDFYEQTHMSA